MEAALQPFKELMMVMGTEGLWGDDSEGSGEAESWLGETTAVEREIGGNGKKTARARQERRRGRMEKLRTRRKEREQEGEGRSTLTKSRRRYQTPSEPQAAAAKPTPSRIEHASPMQSWGSLSQPDIGKCPPCHGPAWHRSGWVRGFSPQPPILLLPPSHTWWGLWWGVHRPLASQVASGTQTLPVREGI